jgi:hypothetical protein
MAFCGVLPASNLLPVVVHHTSGIECPFALLKMGSVVAASVIPLAKGPVPARTSPRNWKSRNRLVHANEVCKIQSKFSFDLGAFTDSLPQVYK